MQWRKCSTCKKPIQFGQVYWVCSVSTCTRQRTGLVFCSVECFDAHVPVLRHRDAGAYEKRAPSQAQFEREQAAQQAASDPRVAAVGVTGAPIPGPSPGPSPTPVLGKSGTSQTPRPVPHALPNGESPLSEHEVLVVVSKVKDYIRERSGMNTSASVMDVLSKFVRRVALQSIARAQSQGRKTVLDRDVPEGPIRLS